MKKTYNKPELTVVDVDMDNILAAVSNGISDETPSDDVVTKDGNIIYGNAKYNNFDDWDEE